MSLDLWSKFNVRCVDAEGWGLLAEFLRGGGPMAGVEL